MEDELNNHEMSQRTEISENDQHQNSADDGLFSDLLSKCQCCFTKFERVEDLQSIEPWHCHAFHIMTGVEMNIDNCIQICLDCVDILEIFSELRTELGGRQARYNEFSQVIDENDTAGKAKIGVKAPSDSSSSTLTADDISLNNRILIEGEKFDMYEGYEALDEVDEAEISTVT